MKKKLFVTSLVLILVVIIGYFIARVPGQINSKRSQYSVSNKKAMYYENPLTIGNYSDWKNFVKDLPTDSETDLSLYNEGYFKKKNIYAVFITTSSSTKIIPKRAVVNGDALELHVKLKSPRRKNADLCSTVCLFEVAKSDIANIKNIKEIIIE